jgi:hypothetical protein
VKWILVRRNADGTAEDVEVEADAPADAIDWLRARLGDGEAVLSVRRADYGLPDPEGSPAPDPNA